MQRPYFNRELLLSVAKAIREPLSQSWRGKPQQNVEQFALAIFHPGEDPSGLISTLKTQNPNARILEVTAPEGQDNIKQYRAMLSEFLFACGEPPLRPSQATAAEARLARLLRERADTVVIHHAERMGTYALSALRRERGVPPVVLIAYSDKVLDTLLKQDALMHQVVLLT